MSILAFAYALLRLQYSYASLADRFGLEKIKTIGDAYMAVAGVPDVRTDHVEAAAEMALETRDSISQRRWPSGAPMSVRIGIACGPVIAGRHRAPQVVDDGPHAARSQISL